MIAFSEGAPSDFMVGFYELLGQYQSLGNTLLSVAIFDLANSMLKKNVILISGISFTYLMIILR